MRRKSPARLPAGLQKKLLSWFEAHKRRLPWRQTKDPYKIWISEVMLQQTVSKTVIPYYRRFIKKFPDLKSLAKASKKEILPLWAGLGYYKRAESLLAAAREISRQGRFPSSYRELQRLPGFGPYTARAVSSLAFQERVGVLDGNVIRFLCRFHGLPFKWWTAPRRRELQGLADLWARGAAESQGKNSARNKPQSGIQSGAAKGPPSQAAQKKAQEGDQNISPSAVNQALMEIGALVCAPRAPLCGLCPLRAGCRAFKDGSQGRLPLRRPKKAMEKWLYQPEKIKKGAKWAFVPNEGRLPFLKGLLIFPGAARKIKSRPETYHFSHAIMSCQIYVSVRRGARPLEGKGAQKPPAPLAKGREKPPPPAWLTEKEITEKNPSSLIKKILRFQEHAGRA